MSKKHIHQVTPHHKGKSGFFTEDGDDINANSNNGKVESMRDLMGGIHEEEDVDEDKMYAHELPPDPFMQKLTIDENEEEDDDDDYASDFLEESSTSVTSTKHTSPSAPGAQVPQLVSPISVTVPDSPSKNKKNSSSTAAILQDANANIDSLIDKVNTVTATTGIPVSSSVPGLSSIAPPSPVSSSPRRQSTSPRSTARSPRSNSTSSKRHHSAQKLRQSPIRVNVQEDSAPQPIVSTPKKTPKKSDHYNDDDFDDFDFDEDFGGEGDTQVAGGGGGDQTAAQQHEKGGDEDEMFETFNPLKEVNTEGEESSNLIEGKLEGMTLEAYMMEYTKAKALDEALDNDNHGEGDDDDKSPPVVDPQGLEGCSPGPGQRHINGTNSPFRIDMQEFGSRDFDAVSDDLYDDDHEEEDEGAGNVSASQNDEILATILTQVQDVQSKLEGLSNTSPAKKRVHVKKEVSFKASSNGEQSNNHQHAHKTKNKNKAHKESSFKHSPIEKHAAHGKGQGDGGESIANKVASGLQASRASTDGNNVSGVGGGKMEQQSSDEHGDTTDSNNTPLEVKVEVLKRQLKKKHDEIKKMEDRMKRMEKDMESLHSKWQGAAADLTATTKKMNKANKAKITAQKRVAEMTQEMQHYESLIQAVEQLRENEAMLLQKVSQLEQQSIETSKALKASMSRELEWRALYKKEHAADGALGHQQNYNQQNHNALPRASSGMNSHRSLPDQDRSHVRQSRPIYERSSITEGRQKKKKKKSSPHKDGGENRQKMLPILISKQRK